MAPRRLRPAWLVPPAVATQWARGRGFCNGQAQRLASGSKCGGKKGAQTSQTTTRAASVTTSCLAERRPDLKCHA